MTDPSKETKPDEGEAKSKASNEKKSDEEEENSKKRKLEGDEPDEEDAEGKPKKKKKVRKLEVIHKTEINLGEADYMWDTLKISTNTRDAIKAMGFERMMEIQAKAIPPLLEGQNMVAGAKTGSGKTLAFLIPTVETLMRVKFKARNGTGAIILTPTRELAIQIYG